MVNVGFEAWRPGIAAIEGDLMNGLRERVGGARARAALVLMAALLVPVSITATAKPVTTGETPPVLENPFANLAGW